MHSKKNSMRESEAKANVSNIVVERNVASLSDN